ncbi:MAG: type II toxin-antitoxin system RelE/ParE family toxin [Bryobacterales bacterium]|nr:type II toxin-antitoxin system RelE/ParE family toxin [Bryobacterales bacterium]
MSGLDRPVAIRVKLAIERFAETGTGDVRRLKGTAMPEFRLRVGDYRIRFQRKLVRMQILRVRHRSQAYR